jgi:hypothetical protein
VSEISNDLTEVNKIAGEKLKKDKRPALNYREMNIPTGAKLVYLKDDHAVEVEVCGDRKVRYKGTETSLTAVTKELLELDCSVQATPYWTYNGKKIAGYI